MAKVIWTEPAIAHLQEIVSHISRNSPLDAVRFGERLLAAPEQLIPFPQIGARVPEFERDDLRELLVAPYRIIYRHADDHCLVLAIVHGHRELARLFRPDRNGFDT